jgi:hypothetical protein
MKIVLSFLLCTLLFSNLYGHNCIHNRIAEEVKIVSTPQLYEHQIAKATGYERTKLLATAEYEPIRIVFNTQYIISTILLFSRSGNNTNGSSN